MTETDAQPSEEEMRAAYEAELNRITSTEMILQTVVSLVNIGGRRLGLGGAPEAQRDLDQVADAIDGARALMPILERRMPAEIAPLRDAISQLQMAYAREVRGAPATQAAGAPQSERHAPSSMESQRGDGDGDGSSEPTLKNGAEGAGPATDGGQRRPGPAESSGRLWVPGR